MMILLHIYQSLENCLQKFKIVGLQNYNVDEKLNLIDINIRYIEMQRKLSI